MLSRGFTLLELSIVLVIIGLIIGGVTVGMGLIKAAELNSIISDFQKYETALHSFKLKYNAVPGDMNNASDYWIGANDGNNNRTIEYTAAGGDPEDLYVWEHLGLSEIIPGRYSGALPYDIGASVPGGRLPQSGYLIYNVATGLYQSSRTGRVIIIGAPQNHAVAPLISESVINSVDAYTIDAKIDNGIADTGKITASQGFSSTLAWSGSCVDDTPISGNPSDYNLSDTAIGCTLLNWID